MQNQELRIEILLEEVVKKRASDLHIQVGLPPMLRIDGSLTPVAGFNPLDEQQVESLILPSSTKTSNRFCSKTRSLTLALHLVYLGVFASMPFMSVAI